MAAAVIYRAKIAGLAVDDLRHISWKTFEAICELDEWAKSSDEDATTAESAFWGM